MTNWFHLYSGFRAKIKWIISSGHTFIFYPTFYHFVSFHFLILFSIQRMAAVVLRTCTIHILNRKMNSMIWRRFFFFLLSSDRLISKPTFLSKNHNRAKAYGRNFSISIHTTYVTHLLRNPYSVPNSYNFAYNENDENSKCFLIIRLQSNIFHLNIFYLNKQYTRTHSHRWKTMKC